MKKTEQAIERTAQDILSDPADKFSNNKPIGFIAPLQAQFGLPHRHVPGNEWERVNGNIKLRVVSASGAGIPSGSTPRVGLAWATTWQVAHPSETMVPLGKNISHFLTEEMQVAVDGRTIARHKLQLLRLFTSSVSIIKIDPQRGGFGFATTGTLAERIEFWENPGNPGKDGRFPSYVIFNMKFRELLLEHPVPIDMRVMPVLRRSPLAIDYYCWLAYRLWRVDAPVSIPWEQLHLQFGSNYDFETKQGRYEFRMRSQYELTERVLKVYPEARLRIDDGGLRLFRSLPPVPLSTRRYFLPGARQLFPQ